MLLQRIWRWRFYYFLPRILPLLGADGAFTARAAGALLPVAVLQRGVAVVAVAVDDGLVVVVVHHQVLVRLTLATLGLQLLLLLQTNCIG